MREALCFWLLDSASDHPPTTRPPDLTSPTVWHPNIFNLSRVEADTFDEMHFVRQANKLKKASRYAVFWHPLETHWANFCEDEETYRQSTLRAGVLLSACVCGL